MKQNEGSASLNVKMNLRGTRAQNIQRGTDDVAVKTDHLWFENASFVKLL